MDTVVLMRSLMEMVFGCDCTAAYFQVTVSYLKAQNCFARGEVVLRKSQSKCRG